MCLYMDCMTNLAGFWSFKIKGVPNPKKKQSNLKSLLLPRSQADGWQMTSRPSVGLDSIDFSQKLSGKGSNPRLVKKSSAVRNIDVVL